MPTEDRKTGIALCLLLTRRQSLDTLSISAFFWCVRGTFAFGKAFNTNIVPTQYRSGTITHLFLRTAHLFNAFTIRTLFGIMGWTWTQTIILHTAVIPTLYRRVWTLICNAHIHALFAKTGRTLDLERNIVINMHAMHREYPYRIQGWTFAFRKAPYALVIPTFHWRRSIAYDLYRGTSRLDALASRGALDWIMCWTRTSCKAIRTGSIPTKYLLRVTNRRAHGCICHA